MKEPLQRQGILVSITELRKIADELEAEAKQQEKELGVSFPRDKRWSLNIINYSRESDTWVFEGYGEEAGE